MKTALLLSLVLAAGCGGGATLPTAPMARSAADAPPLQTTPTPMPSQTTLPTPSPTWSPTVAPTATPPPSPTPSPAPSPTCTPDPTYSGYQGGGFLGNPSPGPIVSVTACVS